MLMMNENLGDSSAVGFATRSLKSWILNASLGLLLIGGPGCFPGDAADLQSAVEQCDASILDSFNLSDDERAIILARCQGELGSSPIVEESSNSDAETHPEDHPNSGRENDNYPEDDTTTDEPGSNGLEDGDNADDAGPWGPNRDDSDGTEPEDSDESQNTHTDCTDEDYQPTETPETCVVVGTEPLNAFVGEWHQDGDLLRSWAFNKTSVATADESSLDDLSIRVDIEQQHEMAEMGLIFRGRKKSNGEGEGYFAMVSSVNQELVLGYARSENDYDILATADLDGGFVSGESATLSVEAQGDHIVASYKNVHLGIFDGRAKSGLVGVMVRKGEGSFRDFFAEGTCTEGFEPVPTPDPFDDGLSGVESLQTYDGEWFTDGYLAGNIHEDEEALLITEQEYQDLFVHTRVLSRTEDTKMGVIFRGTEDHFGNAQGYFAGLSTEDNELVLGYRFADGAEITIESVYMHVEVGKFYSLNVEVIGGRIEVECNGTSLETELEYYFYGVAGLLVTDGLALFSDFYIEDLN